MKNNNKKPFYIFLAIAYLVIAIYYICTGSIFLGVAWVIVSVINFGEAIYMKKNNSHKKEDNDIKEEL